MAQVMINFRVDEDTKRDMELACKEMGLTMTTAFTILLPDRNVLTASFPVK